MTCYPAQGGTLHAPSKPWEPDRSAKVRCKRCGVGEGPTRYVLSTDEWSHIRFCSRRPLEVALDNVRRFAERPSAYYHLDQELAYIRKLLLG